MGDDRCPHCHVVFAVLHIKFSLMRTAGLLFSCPNCALAQADEPFRTTPNISEILTRLRAAARRGNLEHKRRLLYQTETRSREIIPEQYADNANDISLSFETDRTLIAKVVRHSRFYVRYARARYHRKRLNGLVDVVQRRFSDSKSWVVECRLELRKSVGPSRAKDDIHWDAPIIVVTMYRDTEGLTKEACGVSFYIEHNCLYIQQLQGGKSVTFPRKFKVWPQLLLKSCIEFAQLEHFDRVYLAKAATLYAYRWPGTGRSQTSIKEHRERMKLRYDGTARICGFESDDAWFVWPPSVPVQS